jgi:hypothetical protein
MGANDSRRYIVKLEVYAAAGHIDLEKQGDTEVALELDQVLRDLADADPDEIEDQTYRSFRFDLCDGCRKIILQRPLGA